MSPIFQAKPQIESDGRTVWVNAPDGSCIGRFSRFGIDVHRTVSAQIAGESECLDCTHQRPAMAEWHHFQSAMQQHHGVAVGDEHMPRFLAEAGQAC